MWFNMATNANLLFNPSDIDMLGSLKRRLRSERWLAEQERRIVDQLGLSQRGEFKRISGQESTLLHGLNS